MNGIIWIIEQGLGFVVYLFPVSISLTIFLLFGLKKDFKKIKLSHLALAIPFGGIPLIAFIGVKYAYTLPYEMERPVFGEQLIGLVLIVELIYSILIVAKLKGTRIFSLAVCLWAIWISLGVSFISSMNITGRWL
jgi:hypothetical protein